MVSKQQYWAIKAALTSAEKELINFYELQWFLRQTVPTVDEVYQHLRKKFPSIRQTSVNYYLNRQPVRNALTKRGIPFEQHTQDDLTQAQVATAIVMMNFADTRTNTEKLDQLGINASQYAAWLRDPQFKNLIDNLADQNLTNIRPTAIGEFTKKINQGDWNAIKYWLDTTGEMTSSDQPQSEQLLRMIVEIIQKHVKDPETIVAIAQDIKLAAANRTLEVVTQHPAIEAEYKENDPELELAKRKLGFG